MAALLHELWLEGDNDWTFCLAGSNGNGARAMLSASAKLVWTVEANSHFEAMTKYYKHMDWGVYKTEHDWDNQPYPDDWDQTQPEK